jgi:enamine deaminase RidA (YjgF/YER057c/UK114 family)
LVCDGTSSSSASRIKPFGSWTLAANYYRLSGYWYPFRKPSSSGRQDDFYGGTRSAFARGMIVPAGPILYVGGQNGTDDAGNLLEGLEAQTEQGMRNVLAVLAEAGTDPEHVAK